MTFAIITPTIGDSTLQRCLESVKGQDCVHYIVVDGREHFANVMMTLERVGAANHIRTIILDHNVGKGWYGHRVYAAASFLVNEDVLCYLDEDNWVEPNYIQAYQEVLNMGTTHWAYTLRKIVSQDGEYICDDNCESLGQWPVVGDSSNRYHIDTGCFAVPRALAVKVGHHWYGQWGADRQFFSALKAAAPIFSCTNLYTLNYRLGGGTNLASLDMFVRGNQLSHQFYKGVYPWQTQRSKPPSILTYHTTNTNRLS